MPNQTQNTNVEMKYDLEARTAKFGEQSNIVERGV